MSDYRKMGQAMRRRAGAASSTLSATPKTTVDMPDNVGAMMASGSAKMSVGQMVGTLVPKKSGKSGDPTAMGPKPRRTPVKVDASSGERLGAAGRITAKLGCVDPCASGTMTNGRVVPSTMGARQGFSGAASDSMR